MCHYYITRSFARSFRLLRSLLFLKRTRSLTFFIPISHVRYIYAFEQKKLTRSKYTGETAFQWLYRLPYIVTIYFKSKQNKDPIEIVCN